MFWKSIFVESIFGCVLVFSASSCVWKINSGVHYSEKGGIKQPEIVFEIFEALPQVSGSSPASVPDLDSESIPALKTPDNDTPPPVDTPVASKQVSGPEETQEAGANATKELQKTDVPRDTEQSQGAKVSSGTENPRETSNVLSVEQQNADSTISTSEKPESAQPVTLVKEPGELQPPLEAKRTEENGAKTEETTPPKGADESTQNLPAATTTEGATGDDNQQSQILSTHITPPEDKNEIQAPSTPVVGGGTKQPEVPSSPPSTNERQKTQSPPDKQQTKESTPTATGGVGNIVQGGQTPTDPVASVDAKPPQAPSTPTPGGGTPPQAPSVPAAPGGVQKPSTPTTVKPTVPDKKSTTIPKTPSLPNEKNPRGKMPDRPNPPPPPKRGRVPGRNANRFRIKVAEERSKNKKKN